MIGTLEGILRIFWLLLKISMAVGALTFLWAVILRWVRQTKEDELRLREILRNQAEDPCSKH